MPNNNFKPSKPLYGFLQDRKWYEDLLHVALGLVPMAGWIHEHLQWPPGWPFVIDQAHEPKKVTQLVRVEDLYRDNLGYAIGGLIRTAVLVALLIRRW